MGTHEPAGSDAQPRCDGGVVACTGAIFRAVGATARRDVICINTDKIVAAYKEAFDVRFSLL
jgi:hypothetical protein